MKNAHLVRSTPISELKRHVEFQGRMIVRRFTEIDDSVCGTHYRHGGRPLGEAGSRGTAEASRVSADGDTDSDRPTVTVVGSLGLIEQYEHRPARRCT